MDVGGRVHGGAGESFGGANIDGNGVGFADGG